MDFSEKWGTSIDEAVKLALIDLKLTIDEVEVTVLEEPSKGFFGIGSKLAKVRVEKKKPVVTESLKKEEKKEISVKPEKKVKPERNEKPEKVEKSEKKAEKKTEKKEIKKELKEKVTQERPDDLKPVTEHEAITFLNEVIEKMGLKLDIEASMNEDIIYVDIIGKDSGTLIGKRGQTLDAIQYLTSLVVNKNREKYMRVVVDAEKYRAKREKTLEQLAERLADKVVKTGKNVRLEPMNPYERKVIHATLQKNSRVTTRSEGEEPYRRVIIENVK